MLITQIYIILYNLILSYYLEALHKALYEALRTEALHEALYEALRTEALHEALYEALRTEALHEALREALRTEALHEALPWVPAIFPIASTRASTLYSQNSL